MEGHLSLLEKDCNEFKLLSVKQSFECVLNKKTLKTTIQLFYDKGLIDVFPNEKKVIRDFLFVTRRRLDLKEVNDDVIQGF